MTPVLLIALVLFVVGIYGHRLATRYGPRVTLKHEPVDDRAVADAHTRRGAGR